MVGPGLRAAARAARSGALVLGVIFLLAIPHVARAAGLKNFEIDLAGGGSLNGNGAEQAMLIAAWKHQLYPDLLLRVEPTLEYLNGRGDTLWAGGFSLVVRKLAHYKKLTAFVDMGAGANGISNNHWAGRRLGSNFMFDLLVGGGVYITHNISISYRYRHLSNAGLFSYNNGIDSYYVVLGLGI